MSGHTPGPWRTHWNGAVGHLIQGGNEQTGNVVLAVARGLSPGIETATGKANAALISAAPELGDALTLAYEVLIGTVSFARADEAITAARTVLRKSGRLP